ncbi:MAG: TRAP transporter large permease subunit [Ectothiorhodospiraceae bacterium]|nr:TRAP transporter large permease subunit [Ectothiorhodospiraceae bacterium]
MGLETLAILMVVSFFVLILLGIPIALAIAASGLIFGYLGFGPGLFALLPSRVYGVITNYTLMAIPLFVFMGVMLEKSRISERMLDVAARTMGNMPGGMTLAIVVVGVLMGASTGIVGATVVMVGLMAIPPLMARGYSKPLAAGTICASGTLGQILPPSLVLILLSDIVGESVGSLFAAALMPGLLLAGAYVIYILVLARLRPDLAPPIPQEELGSISAREIARDLLMVLLPPLGLIFLVLGSIIGGVAAPTEAAAMGAFGALLLVLFWGRLTFSTLRSTLRDTLVISGMIFFVLIAAQVFALAFRGLRGETLVAAMFDWVPGELWGALIFMMVLIFILGFFLEWIEISYIALPLMLPIFVMLQVDMVWLAILVTLNLQTSFLTPPFGWALFFLRGVAPPEMKTWHIYLGALPFIGIQIVVLALVMIFPGIATWLPQAIGW